MKTIDSIQPPTTRHQPLGSTAQTPRPTGTGARFTAFTRTPKRRRAWGMVLTVALSPLLFGLAIVGTIGLAVVVLYALVALIRRWPSRMLFTLALAALLYMVILQLAAAADMAQSMAALAYILLAFGVISLAIEIKMSQRMWFKKH